ncbi:hypothetical protein PPL_09690 [Heterostelium album PN500]|uniref:Pesticidal crystal protein domain-containing protein n=1 Tax=Heterostelium pallidum (strain ATCC 26659 / Pp 5 / PN500) TaxID=670386 RepID=D3BNI7_HETP5|nr:hypothetical protein PPL_09690 [Heterostelium album PN500]EFA76938.1 hypothetical protein PPL_09690 [Heterostelium album PN500]|eukprot:XP_020429070.1 hypothetical protein PPL_09690 [Heterostelium album PN500]
MATPALPTDRSDWIKQQQDMITNVLKTSALPTVSQSTDFNELIKATVVGSTAMIPIVGGGVSTIIDAIWSHILSNQTSNTNALTAMYMNMVKEVVDQQISVYDNADLIAEYAGIDSYINNFKTKLANYTAKPTNVTLKNEMRTAFTTAEQRLKAALVPKGIFRKVGYEVTELMMFTIAATTHLLLLRQVIANGKTWGYPAVDLTGFKNDFKAHIVEYTQHCKVTYANGWSKIAADSTKVGGGDTFNHILRYRSTMISSVFDYVSMWYTFDQDVFPLGAIGERVRYLWSDVLGWTIDINQPVPGILIEDNLYYNPPSSQFYNYWDSVMQHEKFRGQLHHVDIKGNPFLYTMTPYYYDQTQTSGYRQGFAVGDNPNIGTLTTMTFPPTGATQTLSMSSDVIVRKIQVTGVTNSINYVSPAPGRNDHNNPIAYYYDDCRTYGLIDSVCVGFIPSEVFPENVLVAKSETIVDPQKAFYMDAGVLFKKDFTMVGQHAFEMSDKETIKLQVQLQDPKQYTYTIRLRVSCQDKVPGKISILNANQVLLSTFNYVANSANQLIASAAEPDYIFTFATDKPTKIWLKALGGTVVLQSIIFKPVPAPKPAA